MVMPTMLQKPRFFSRPERFRAWLEKNHATKRELWVGYYRKDAGRASITWPESVDEALCVGWIDGIRKSIDEESYMIRFTPRKPTSNWSAVNIKRVAVLTKEGRMQAAGIEAFRNRAEEKSGIYAYEQRKTAALDEEFEAQFRANDVAWKFFEAQPPSYRTTMIWWVVSAKREETRRKRLARLIDDSRKGRRV